MQVGIDSFAAAFDENSHALNPRIVCNNWSSRSSMPTRSVWTRLALANTIVASSWIRLRPSSSAPPRHGRSAFV